MKLFDNCAVKQPWYMYLMHFIIIILKCLGLQKGRSTFKSYLRIKLLHYTFKELAVEHQINQFASYGISIYTRLKNTPHSSNLKFCLP